VRAAGAEYVLLNVPEHGSRWRDADGPVRYRQYVDTLRRFAEVEQIPFVDVTDGDAFRFDAPNAFGDLSHMTASASLRFTNAIARRLLPSVAAAARRGDDGAAIVAAVHPYCRVITWLAGEASC
jgi:hypothetical protein